MSLVRHAAQQGEGEASCPVSHREDGGKQHDAEQAKAVGVAHDRRLGPDRIADGDDGLVPCFADARDPVGHGVLLQVPAEKLRIDGARGSVLQEVLLQLGDPLAGCRLEQRHMAVDDEGKKLLALGKERFDSAVPIAPPRLRIILNRPDAAPASVGAIPTIAIAESAAKTIA